MKKTATLLTLVLIMLSALVGCGKQTSTVSDSNITGELLYRAISDARTEEFNAAYSILNNKDAAELDLFTQLLGLNKADMKEFALSASLMNVKAYGIAIILPEDGREEAVTASLQDFINSQKQAFDRYLPDQKAIADQAILKKVSGCVVMVMSEGQDEIFASIEKTLQTATKS